MSETIPVTGLPIADDDAAIAAALEEASVPTLLMSMIHMTGDASLLKGDIRPQGIYLNEVQGFMSPEDQAKVRAQALEVIKAYRDSGCRLPPPPSNETINEMMSFLVAEPVPAEYVPMMLEEMELDGQDARRVSFDGVPKAARENFHVLVIGGGMSGVLAAIRLEEAGIPYTVIEKNASVGGTWYENTYPGCRVDVGNHFYCYSFEPNHEWTRFFAKQPELRAYFESCIEKYGIGRHFRFETEVVEATFDEAANRWNVTLRERDGNESSLVTNAMISAVGQLNRPKLPDIKGVGTFAGPAFHSARWEPVELKDKRVAVIGTGASAFQIVPEIAPQVAELHVFQRSAPWMFPNPHYHETVGEGTKWVLKHLPYYARWYRFLLFWPACDGLLPQLKIDPSWPHQDKSINEGNEIIRQVFTDYLAQQVGDDEELLEKVTPNYVVLGTRTLQDNGSWLSALKRDNVELVTDPVAEITETGVLCESGRHHDVDIIVYATGFYANRFLWPMKITGRDGVDLHEMWGDDPEAYLGITVPGFPNLFCCYGPGTNLAFGGSLIFHSECQVRYIMGCIRMALENGAHTVEVRQDVHDQYNRRLQSELSQMVWSHPTIRHSWYRNSKGKVTVLSPWRLLDYWQWTRNPDAADFTLA